MSQSPAGRADAGRLLGAIPELVGIVVVCALLWQTRAWESNIGGPGPTFYPRLVLGALLVALVLETVSAVRRRGPAGSDDPSALPWSRRRAVEISLLCIAYVAGATLIGWVLATTVFVVVFLWLTGRRRLVVTVPFAAAVALTMAYVFVRVVYIALPLGQGPFEDVTVLLYEIFGMY